MWNQDIICPYCSHVNDDTNVFEHESGEEWECSNCGEYFILEVEYEPIYRVNKI